MRPTYTRGDNYYALKKNRIHRFKDLIQHHVIHVKVINQGELKSEKSAFIKQVFFKFKLKVVRYQINHSAPK